MNEKKLKIACLCGKGIGQKVCRFLLDQDVLLKVSVNDYEKKGEWYPTPRSLDIDEISLEQVVSFEPDLIVVAFYDTILRENIFPSLGLVAGTSIWVMFTNIGVPIPTSVPWKTEIGSIA